AGAETVEHDEASPTPVTFVSYNLRNYLEMERRVDGEVVADAPKPEDEIAALVEGLAAIRPDILSVCEIGDATHIADLQSRLKAVGIDLPYTEMVTDSAGWNRNLALLSRFPIVGRYSRDDYTYELAGTRHAFQRGVLDVKLAIRPHYHLRCVGLHLKSKREVPEGDQALMRLNEAHLARRHLDRILKEEPGVNLLVTGDFNDTRIEAPVKTLRGAYGRPGYLRALRLADEAGFTWTHYWAFADVYSRFDYALYSKGLSAEINRNLCRIHHWEDWEKASDHRPLVISLLPVDR
ncbi:MAG: endonuclease/exonuclease/phosphatase family protein, partial [Verrucomicrobiaceae bacterium]|nr:endonuclease/exonuclease/phosphatase family protein [Verrucomicrobiaceae bacterium]